MSDAQPMLAVPPCSNAPAAVAPDLLPADLLGAPPVGGLQLVDLLVTAWLHWRVVALAFFLPVLLGLTGALLTSPRYTAESVLLVQSTRENAGTPDLTGFGPAVVSVEILKVVRAEMETLRSMEVLRRALAQAGLTSIFPGIREDGKDALARGAEALQQALHTEPDTASNVLRVSMTMPDRDRALRALGAVIDAYLARRSEMVADEGAHFLAGELGRYGERLRGIEDAIRQVHAEYGVLDIAQEMQLATSQRGEILQHESRVREQQAMTRAQLIAAEAALAVQPKRVFASAEASNLTPNDDLPNALSRLLQERERMAQQYVAGYPGLSELDQRITTLKASLREDSRIIHSTTREVRNPNLDILGEKVVTLRLETEALERQRGELARQRQQADEHAAVLLAADRKLRDLAHDREGIDTIIRQIATREAGMRIDTAARQQFQAGIRIVQPPTAPLKGQSLRRVVLAGGMVGGFAFAGATVLLLAFTRRILVTPEEAERALRLPALACCRPLDPAARSLKTMSEIEDMVALLRDARVSGRRLRAVQIVGSDAGDARGELGRALAVSLARLAGGELVLIDLQTDGSGHLDALGAQPAQTEPVPGCRLVPSTVLPNLWISREVRHSGLVDPRATWDETRNLLDRLHAAFEMVLVIGPDETDNYAMRRLAALVDANIMVVGGGCTTGPRARAVRDWVLGAGGALLGFAFTGYRPLLPAALARLS